MAEAKKSPVRTFKPRKGRVRISGPVSLSDSAVAGSLVVSPKKTAEGYSPAERVSARSAKRRKKRPLSHTLTALASALGPGRGKIGRTVSGAVSGAALGAILGEAIDERPRRRKEKK
jgi:hypothetical protein